MKDSKKLNSEQEPNTSLRSVQAVPGKQRQIVAMVSGTKTSNFKYQTSNQHLIFAEIFSI